MMGAESAVGRSADHSLPAALWVDPNSPWRTLCLRLVRRADLVENTGSKQPENLAVRKVRGPTPLRC